MMKTKEILHRVTTLILLFILNISASAQSQWTFETEISTGAYSSGIAITPDNSKLVVTNNTSPGTIKVISTSNYAISAISYPADGYPNGVAITPDGLTAVVNTMHQTIYIDLSANSVSGNFVAPCAGTTLYGIAVNSNNAIYPDLSSGCTQQGLRTINATPPSSSSSFSQINTSGVLLGIAITGSSAIVTAWNAAPVHVNLTTSGVQNITGMNGSYGVAILHSGNEALINDGDSLYRVSLSNNRVTKTISYLSLNTSFQNIAITDDDKYAFVVGAFEKLIISLADNTVIQTFSAGGTNVAATSDGSRFFVTNSYNGTVRVYKKVIPTGMGDLKKAKYNVTVYPNPTYGKITISNSEKISAIEIYNVLGEKIFYSTTLQLNNATIDLSFHPKGTYFVKIYDGEQFHTEKIVIQ
jgi:DNA-binding beta-propeller fold protein YncE